MSKILKHHLAISWISGHLKNKSSAVNFKYVQIWSWSVHFRKVSLLWHNSNYSYNSIYITWLCVCSTVHKLQTKRFVLNQRINLKARAICVLTYILKKRSNYRFIQVTSFLKSYWMNLRWLIFLFQIFTFLQIENWCCSSTSTVTWKKVNFKTKRILFVFSTFLK